MKRFLSAMMILSAALVNGQDYGKILAEARAAVKQKDYAAAEMKFGEAVKAAGNSAQKGAAIVGKYQAMRSRKKSREAEKFALDAVEKRIQDFFAKQDMDDLRAYELDGTPQSEPAMHPVAIKAVLGAASIGSESEHRMKFLKQFAEMEPRKGKRRYYDNCLYFFCLLMLTGNYRIYM